MYKIGLCTFAKTLPKLLGDLLLNESVQWAPVAKLSSRTLRVLRYDFAKLKRRLRSFRLKRFEVYANFARPSTLMSVKFVVAKHSFQTLRGVR